MTTGQSPIPDRRSADSTAVQAIRNALIERGVSQRTLAKMADIHKSILSRKFSAAEDGTCSLSAKHRRQLLTACDILLAGHHLLPTLRGIWRAEAKSIQRQLRISCVGTLAAAPGLLAINLHMFDADDLSPFRFHLDWGAESGRPNTPQDVFRAVRSERAAFGLVGAAAYNEQTARGNLFPVAELTGLCSPRLCVPTRQEQTPFLFRELFPTEHVGQPPECALYRSREQDVRVFLEHLARETGISLHSMAEDESYQCSAADRPIDKALASMSETTDQSKKRTYIAVDWPPHTYRLCDSHLPTPLQEVVRVPDVTSTVDRSKTPGLRAGVPAFWRQVKASDDVHDICGRHSTRHILFAESPAIADDTDVIQSLFDGLDRACRTILQMRQRPDHHKHAYKSLGQEFWLMNSAGNGYALPAHSNSDRQDGPQANVANKFVTYMEEELAMMEPAILYHPAYVVRLQNQVKQASYL